MIRTVFYFLNIIFILSVSLCISGCMEKNAENKIKDDLLSSSMGLIKSADIHSNNNEMEIEAISGYTGDFGSGILYVVPYLIYVYIEAYDANPNIKRCDFTIIDQENKQKVSMYCLDEWIKPIKYVTENEKHDENGEAAEAAFTYLFLKVMNTAEPKIAPFSDSSGEITNLYEIMYKNILSLSPIYQGSQRPITPITQPSKQAVGMANSEAVQYFQKNVQSIPAEEWDKTFGGPGIDEGRCVRQTADGGYIITGKTTSVAGNKDLWLIKTDANGEKIWDKTFGGAGGDEGRSVQQTQDGGYIVTGWTDSFGSGASDVWLIKTDSNGNKVWDKTFGGSNNDGGNAVLQTKDGGYAIAAWTSSYGAGGWDGWLIRTDKDGNRLWDKTFGGPKNDGLNAIIEEVDGGLILTGSTESFPSGTDAWLIKIDSYGNKIWDKHIGNYGHNVGESLQKASDGGYIIAGETDSSGNGGLNVWLVKTDLTGNKIWDKDFGGKGPDYGWSVNCTNDGGYVIASGEASFGAGSYDVWIIKTDANGNKIWDKTFGGIYGDWGTSTIQSVDGCYVVTGGVGFDGPKNGDLWLLKVKTTEQG